MKLYDFDYDEQIERMENKICLFSVRFFSYLVYYSYFCLSKTNFVRIMTAIELNAQIWRDMGAIADSEPLMRQLAKYLKKLVAKKSDPTLMTKDEFFAKLDEAEREIAEGNGIKMLPNESLDDFLKRIG